MCKLLYLFWLFARSPLTAIIIVIHVCLISIDLTAPSHKLLKPKLIFKSCINIATSYK